MVKSQPPASQRRGPGTEPHGPQRRPTPALRTGRLHNGEAGDFCW